MQHSQSVKAVTLSELCRDIWRARKIVLMGAVCGVLCAGLFVIVSVPHFRAQMMISPAAPMGMMQTSSVLGDQDLFALQQILKGLGHENKSEFSRFEHMVSAPSVARKLLEDPKIKAGLARDGSVRLLSADALDTPEELARYIERRVRLEPVAATSMRRMVYYHPNREFGVYFLHALHRTADDLISGRIRGDTAARIAYLKDALNQRQLHPEHKRAITSLLLEQERLNMLVSGQTSYAARVAEPPYASVKAVWPNMAFVFSVIPLVFVFVFYGVSSVFGSGKAIHGISYKRWTGRVQGNENHLKPDSSFSSRDAAE